MSLQTAVDATNDTGCFKSTLKQRLLVAGVAEGQTIAAAGAAAGYRSRQNARDAFVNARDRLLSTMDDVGLTERTIVERLRDQMWATKTVTASFMGEISDSLEIADNAAIGKAIETAARMRRMIDSDSAVSVGTVNVMFAGALPDWLQGQASVDGAGPACASEPSTPAQHHIVTGDSIVHRDASAITPPPLSALEGTGREGGGCTHTNSGNLASSNCVVTGETVPVETVPVKAGTKLSQRIVKKRQARLPVFRGQK